MLQPGDGFGLTDKTRQLQWTGGSRCQHFQGDDPREFVMARFVDHTHPAAAENSQYVVASNLRQLFAGRLPMVLLEPAVSASRRRKERVEAANDASQAPPALTNLWEELGKLRADLLWGALGVQNLFEQLSDLILVSHRPQTHQVRALLDLAATAICPRRQLN